MSRFNTGNPLGSGSPLDLDDNAKNLDEAVNSDKATWTDRFGRQRATYQGAVDPTGLIQTAVDAADQAETARDAAFINADVYPDVASGLAAVADGGQFQVLAPNTVEFVRYQNDSGTATEVGRMPSSRFVHTTYRDAVSSIQNAVLSYPLPTALPVRRSGSNTSPLIFDPEASFDNGDAGLGVYTDNAGLVSVDAMAELSGLAGETTVITVEFQKSSASASNVGFGITRYDSAGLSGVIYRDDGAIYYNFPDGTRPTLQPADIGRSYVAGDRVSLELTYDASLGQFTVRTFKNGEPSPVFVADSFPTSGKVGFAVRGSGIDGVLRVIKRVDVAGVELDPEDLAYLDRLTEKSAQVTQIKWDAPSSLPTILGAGTIQVSGERPFLTEHYSLQIDARDGPGANRVVAVQLGDGLLSGGVVRMSATYLATIGGYTPALGLGFGSEEDYAKGFGIRNTAQLLALEAHSNTTGGATGPTPPTFDVGDRITLDARLSGESPGGYTIRYYLEYPDGSRYGPYDVEGVEDISHTWFMCRASSLWGDVEVTLHKAPLYADELISEGSDPQPTAGPSIVYVSVMGDDSGTGGESSPFRTINKAISSLPNGGIVEVSGGEYRESISYNNPNSIWIRSKRGERAVVLGSDKLDVSKTTGYSQVYQAPLADKPVGMGGARGQPVIFEWGAPSKPIPAEERHALQRGKTHRLPYTEMFEAGSLAELDTVDGLGKWWWDAGVIYFTATDGGDAIAKRYEARVRPLVSQAGGGLRLSRMTLMFSNRYGAVFRGDTTLTEDVVVLGSHHNGFYMQSGIWKSYRDEAGGNGNDGFNGTVADRSGTDDSISRITAFFYDSYGHDNGDDGTSFHYRGDATYYGGLFEHNTKADVVHVTGAAVTCYDTVARGSVNGFYSATEPVDDPSREMTSMRCVGTKAYDNQYAYRASSSSVLECDNAVAVNPSVFGYAQASDGVLVARNSKYTGDPAKMKDGDVEVINDGALT